MSGATSSKSGVSVGRVKVSSFSMEFSFIVRRVCPRSAVTIALKLEEMGAIGGNPLRSIRMCSLPLL